MDIGAFISMNIMAKINQLAMIDEIKHNLRLQWMLVLIAVIILLSLAKSFSDLKQQLGSERDQQHGFYQRILTAANQPLDENTVIEAKNMFQQAFSALPLAVSDSVAQAQALKRMDAIIKQKIRRPRVALVASEPVIFGNTNGWQVRMNVAGQMPEKALIQLLADISGDQANVRLLSMQYNPKASDSVAFVVDFLYMAEQRNES
jgi:hypothetical protein